MMQQNYFFRSFLKAYHFDAPAVLREISELKHLGAFSGKAYFLNKEKPLSWR
jgi:hypothetical protein